MAKGGILLSFTDIVDENTKKLEILCEENILYLGISVILFATDDGLK
jgi:hypothetical protein